MIGTVCHIQQSLKVSSTTLKIWLFFETWNPLVLMDLVYCASHSEGLYIRILLYYCLVQLVHFTVSCILTMLTNFFAQSFTETSQIWLSFSCCQNQSTQGIWYGLMSLMSSTEAILVDRAVTQSRNSCIQYVHESPYSRLPGLHPDSVTSQAPGNMPFSWNLARISRKLMFRVWCGIITSVNSAHVREADQGIFLIISCSGMFLGRMMRCKIINQ